MDHNTTEVIEILGFKVIETRYIEDGRIIKNRFTIRNKDGEVVSRDYENIEEPAELLRSLAKFLDSNNDKKRE